MRASCRLWLYLTKIESAVTPEIINLALLTLQDNQCGECGGRYIEWAKEEVKVGFTFSVKIHRKIGVIIPIHFKNVTNSFKLLDVK